MIDHFSHRLKRRLLMSCLSTLIGGPLMCCCLVGMFQFVLPAIDRANPADYPTILVQAGVGATILFFIIALAVIAVYLYRRNFNIMGIFRGEGLQPAGLPRFRQISILALVFGMPLAFLAVALIAYLIVTTFG